MKTLFLTLFAAASLMAGDAQTTTSKKTEKPSIGPTQLSPAGSATDHDRASKDATPAALDREQKIFQKLQYGVWITFDDPAQPAVLLNSLKPAIQQVTDEGTVNKDGPTLPPPVDDNIDAYSQTTEHQRRGEQVVFDNSGLKDPRASVPRRFTDMEMIAVVDAFVMLDPEFEQAKQEVYQENTDCFPRGGYGMVHDGNGMGVEFLADVLTRFPVGSRTMTEPGCSTDEASVPKPLAEALEVAVRVSRTYGDLLRVTLEDFN